MGQQLLRALFFDIDDTVFSTTEFARLARGNAVRAMIKAGLRMAEEDCLRELNEVIDEFSSNYEHHFDKLLLRIPPETYAQVSSPLLVAAGMVAYHETKSRNLVPYEDAIEVLKVLKQRRLTLGIITAGVEIKQAEKIVRLGLHPLVSSRYIFITDSLGIAKSNPKLYLRACKTAGAVPEECMYVGDNPEVDVDVPHTLGMKTVLSRRSGKYQQREGQAHPDHVVHNFWDLLEVIDAEYKIIPGG